MSEGLTARQWGIIFLIAAVQFINILDFVMVMPLGPMLAGPLGIHESELGLVAGCYTAAASLSGLLGAFFLDRFDRRKALAVALFGLVLGTLMGGAATGKWSLLGARMVAGAFGGPATSIAFSIIADAIPLAFRGRAMGTVMGAFSIASILGVPTGLWLAEQYGWSAPFIAVGALGAVVIVFAVRLLPPMTGHLERGRTSPIRFRDLLSRPIVRLSYLMTFIVMFAGFIVIPNISAFLQMNLSLPSTALKYAYMFGGVASLITTQVGGRLVDRYGSFRVGTFGVLSVSAASFAFFVRPLEMPPPTLIFTFFVLFMISNGLRNVAYNTLTTKVVEPQVRARFQSLQSSIQHAASALAAGTSSQILRTIDRPPGFHSTSVKILEHMPVVATVSIACGLSIPFLLRLVEKRVRAQTAATAP